MDERDIISILSEDGWIVGRDEAGDYFCVKLVGDLQIQVIPHVDKRPGHISVSLMESVSSKSFSEAASFIFGRRMVHVPVVVKNDVPEKLTDFSSSDVIRLRGKVMSWASGQDLSAGLETYRNLPTNAKGAMPIRHLAALAVAGDVGRLEGYKHNFDAGNRLNFVPYINEEMIGRALLKARCYALQQHSN